MAGAQINIEVRDAPLRAAFARLAKQGELMQAALKNIGEALVRSTRERFSREQSPAGVPWAALRPDYAAAKKGAKILSESGQLSRSVVYQVEPGRLRIGTNKVQAAIHQFGGTIVPRTADALAFRIGGRLVIARKVTIPARPFLGISDSDRGTMVEIAEDHVQEAWKPK